MPYDLHIVRTDDWLDAAIDPITKEHVDALIALDPQLAWSTEDWVDMRDETTNQVIRYYMIHWNGKPTFWWYGDQITCSGPNEPDVMKMVEMAERLNANVFGDDGEAYRPQTWRATYRGELK
jgi:hypothetical protein